MPKMVYVVIDRPNTRYRQAAMLRPGTTYGPNGTRKPLTPLPFSFLRITGTASDTTMKAVSVPMLTISHRKVASTKPATSPTTMQTISVLCTGEAVRGFTFWNDLEIRPSFEIAYRMRVWP